MLHRLLLLPQIPREPDAGNPRIRTITITSSSLEGVQAAQAEVMRLVQSQADLMGGGGGGSGAGPGPLGGAPESVVSLNVPNDRCVVGW